MITGLVPVLLLRQLPLGPDFLVLREKNVPLVVDVRLRHLLTRPLRLTRDGYRNLSAQGW